MVFIDLFYFFFVVMRFTYRNRFLFLDTVPVVGSFSAEIIIVVGDGYY